MFERICAMIHPGRVGSTALSVRLGSLPMVVAGEIHNVNVNRTPDWADRFDYVSFLQHCLDNAAGIAQPYTGRVPVQPLPPMYFFEFKPFHTGCNDALAVAASRFAAAGVTDFVLLNRRNYLRRYVSYLVSLQTGVWHTQEHPTQTPRVHVDLHKVKDHEIGFFGGTLLEALDHYEDSYLAASLRLEQSHRALALWYEDDIETDPDQAFFKVRDFLGCCPDTLPQHCDLRRQNPQPLRALISNFDEVVDFLRGTRHAALAHG